MKKIMFSQRYGLEQKAIDGSKPVTRRELGFSEQDRAIFDNLTPAEREAMTDIIIARYSRYKVGEVVAIAQCYKHIAWHTNTPMYVIQNARALMNTAGWSNKMFVKAMYMPNRIRITNIRIERLQDITEDDCLKEGIQELAPCSECGGPMYCFPDFKELFCTPHDAFAVLYDKISGNGAWDKNPWVFVYTYEKAV